MQGLLQEAGWRLGSFRGKNPTWEQMRLKFRNMQLRDCGGVVLWGAERSEHSDLCLVEE